MKGQRQVSWWRRHKRPAHGRSAGREKTYVLVPCFGLLTTDSDLLNRRSGEGVRGRVGDRSFIQPFDIWFLWSSQRRFSLTSSGLSMRRVCSVLTIRMSMATSKTWASTSDIGGDTKKIQESFKSMQQAGNDDSCISSGIPTACDAQNFRS